MWAADSRSVFLLKGRIERSGTNGSLLFEQGKELWRVTLEGQVQQFTSDLAKGTAQVRLHPDGRQVVYQVNETEPRQPVEIWVMENLLPRPGTGKP
jgi:tricorn protease-like protein